MIGSDNWEDHWGNFHHVTKYEPARAWRRKIIIRFLILIGNERILDLGSGKGDLIRDLKELSKNFTFGATDVSWNALQMVSKENNGILFAKVDLNKPIEKEAENLLLVRGFWDVVICSEVLEHLDNVSNALSTMRNLTTENSQIVLTVPAGPIAYVDRAFGHRRHYTKDALIEKLELEGFRIERIACAGFPFFNLYRLGLIFRGKKVVKSIEKMSNDKNDYFSKSVFKVFSLLFRLNTVRGNFGWQLIVKCRKI